MERTTREQDQRKVKLDEGITAFRRIHVFRTDDGASRRRLTQELETRSIRIRDSEDRIRPVMDFIGTGTYRSFIAEALVHRLGLRCFPCPPYHGPGFFAIVPIVGKREGPRISDIKLNVLVMSSMESEEMIISRSLENTISLLDI